MLILIKRRDLLIFKVQENVFLVSRENGDIVGEVTAGSEIAGAPSPNIVIDQYAPRRSNKSYLGYGEFFWSVHNVVGESFSNIRPHVLSRLMLLATYSNYEGMIVDEGGNALKRSAMCKVLSISPSCCHEFLKAVTEEGLLLRREKAYYLSPNIFGRGSLNPRKRKQIYADGKKIARVYNEVVQALYYKDDGNAAFVLGYLFKLMPYANVEYNIICTNPLEKELSKIKPMSSGDVAELLGYGRSNASTLYRRFLSESFVLDGKEHNIINKKRGGKWGSSRSCTFVNPLIYYAGSRHEEVSFLGEFKPKLYTNSEQRIAPAAG